VACSHEDGGTCDACKTTKAAEPFVLEIDDADVAPRLELADEPTTGIEADSVKGAIADVLRQSVAEVVAKEVSAAMRRARGLVD
jgi:hypothetical protein